MHDDRCLCQSQYSECPVTLCYLSRYGLCQPAPNVPLKVR